VWDIPTITRKDSSDDANLLADLAEATGGLALQPFGQTEILAALTPDQVKATRDKIAVKFPRAAFATDSAAAIPEVERLGARTRTISPFSDLTVSDWVKNRIKEGTLDDLRGAMLVDPANPRLIAHFGWALAVYAFQEGIDPSEARRARGDADFQTRRALKLASDNDEVRQLRAEVVKLLRLPE
jgi:hypothetical protein